MGYSLTDDRRLGFPALRIAEKEEDTKLTRKIALAAVAAALLASGHPALATPSTLVWIPSTDIQADRVWHVGIDNYFTPGSAETDATVLGLTYGLANRAEVGVDYFTDTGSPWFINGKILLVDEKENLPRVVAGAYNYSFDDDVGQNLVYGLVSKYFDEVRLTLGYAWGREAVLGDDNDMILAGIDMTLNDKWWIAADYQGGDSALGAFSVGAAYKVADNASVLVGYDWFNGDFTDTVTVQVDLDVASW